MKKSGQTSRGFTLPEVIVSIAVLVMVLTAASDILSNVIRSNSDNLNSLVANGYAQEALETIRYIRDTDHWLGLDFNGAKGSAPDSIWGAKLFEAEGIKSFQIEKRETVLTTCTKANLADCLPVSLKEAASVGVRQDLGKGFSREVLVEALKSTATVTAVDLLRVTSIVYWTGPNGQERKVVLTTELTDWKNA